MILKSLKNYFRHPFVFQALFAPRSEKLHLDLLLNRTCKWPRSEHFFLFGFISMQSQLQFNATGVFSIGIYSFTRNALIPFSIQIEQTIRKQTEVNCKTESHRDDMLPGPLCLRKIYIRNDYKISFK